MNKLILALLTSSALLAGCGDNDEPLAAGLPLPPASASRWVAIETDKDGDGLADSITRFGYDTLGRRINQTTWTADRGIAIGEPVDVQTWSYDGASRVLEQLREVRDADPSWRSITAAYYGTDGLLASTTLRYNDGPDSERTTYTWQDQRLVEAKQELYSPKTYRLSYDAAGRVSRVERRGGCCAASDEVSFVESYDWRTDGQLATATFDTMESDYVYVLEYDLNGRHIRTYRTSDGFDQGTSLYFHDAAGRIERVETGEWTDRIRWENGLCQPVFLPSLPPEFDRSFTDEARADGAMLGCANS